MSVTAGTFLRLTDQGDGWFPLAPAGGIRGQVIATLPATDAGGPFYLLKLDAALERQEAAADTPSGLRLQIYDRLVVRSRWSGVPIDGPQSVSVLVFLVPEASVAPTSVQECLNLPVSAWAACIVEDTCA